MAAALGGRLGVPCFFSEIGCDWTCSPGVRRSRFNSAITKRMVHSKNLGQSAVRFDKQRPVARCRTLSFWPVPAGR
jgi:hypothetical protein